MYLKEVKKHLSIEKLVEKRFLRFWNIFEIFKNVENRSRVWKKSGKMIIIFYQLN